MATLRLYQFGKKQNSTALPSGSFYELTGQFRGPVDVLHPVIRLEQAAGVNLMTSYNYAYLLDTGRYYWVTGKTAITDALFDYTLSVDPLATYKAEIGLSSQYVLRSSAAYTPELIDTFYPLEAGGDVVKTDISACIPWINAGSTTLGSGFYVVGILNNDSTTYGAASYYVFPAATFEALKAALMSDVQWTGMQFTEIEEELYKSLFNPYQYIVSCKWFPIAPPYSSADGQTGIRIGWWPLTFGSNRVCFPLKQFSSTGTADLSAVHHTLSLLRGTWLNTNPYLTREIYVEPFGTIALDVSKIYGSAMFPRLEWWIDFVTGKAKLRVLARNNSDVVIGEAEAMLGIDIILAQSTQNMLGAGMSVVNSAFSGINAITGAFTKRGSQFASGLQGVANGIASAVDNFMPSVSKSGTNGSVLAFGVPALDITTMRYPSNEDNADHGRPLCEVRQISTIPGFIMVDHAHLSISSALDPEISMIAGAMESGFYYE